LPLIALLLAAAPAMLPGRGQALAAERTFLGLDITEASGSYLVTKDANVRAEPKTEGRKLGSLEAGARIEVVGKAKGGGGWMAVTRDGKDFGFVYALILLPLIDGTLDGPISGRVLMDDHSPCGYTLRFIARSTLEGENSSFSDYEVAYRCNDKGKPFQFLAPTFMTEVPYKLNQDPVYQITIDLLEIDNGKDEVFSTTFLYQRDKNRVAFDGVSLQEMGRIPKETVRTASSVAEALSAAAEMAPNAWAEKAWKQIAKAHAGDGR